MHKTPDGKAIFASDSDPIAIAMITLESHNSETNVWVRGARCAMKISESEPAVIELKKLFKKIVLKV